MKAFVAICMLVVGSSVQGQSNPAQTGSATAKGDCAVSHSGNYDTIKIENCGIGKEQGDKIIRLLRASLTKKDLAQINAKLDELIELAEKPTTQIQNCVGSNCVQNGNQTNVDQRQYGVSKPLPIIVGLNVKLLAGVPMPIPPNIPDNATANERALQMQRYRSAMRLHGPVDANPGMSLDFKVSEAFQNPMFLVHCENPCVPTFISFYAGGNSSGQTPELFSMSDPRIVLIGAGGIQLLTSDVMVTLTVRSQRDEPIGNVTVEAYAR
jgi:hypothetical protein